MLKKLLAVAGFVLAASGSSAQIEIGGALPTPLPLFPPDNWWNLDISEAPVDPSSTAFINFIGANTTLHPDCGGEQGSGNEIYGMPYVVVPGDQPKVAVDFEYSDESDGVNHDTDTSFAFYPIPNAAKTQPHYIEQGDPGNVCHGRPSNCGDYNDRHMLIVDRDNKYLYELYSLYWNGSKWVAGSGAFFDMNANDRRPEGWTSADAAGLAILPGLMRYDEVYGPDDINHALRMTVSDTNGYVYPASHEAGDTAGALPMGARLRLKPGKNIAGGADIQKIVRAMKKYGLLVADNGSDMYIGGTFDNRWDNGILNPAFASLKASDFEVIKRGFKPTHTLAVGNVQVAEGNSGSTDATFTVTLAAAHTVAITVEYATADGTATAAGGDYVSTSGVLTFDPGVLTRTFTVTVSGDAVGEPNETFVVNLANPTNGTISDSQGVGTILNDDPPDISIADASRVEGATGTSPLNFAVTLSNPYLADVTVAYVTSDGTAQAPTDYTASSGTLTIPSGSTKGTIAIPVVADTIDESDETFTVNLLNPVNGTIVDGNATGTISDEDTAGSVQFGAASYSVAENGVQMVVPVTRSGGNASGAGVDCVTSDGTAQAPADYTAVVRHLVFDAGVNTKNCVVPIVSDTVDELQETINLSLGNLQNGLTLGAQSTTVIKIADDDTAGVVAFKAALFQVNEAAATATVAVVRTGGTSSGVTVSYATSDGSATAGGDYASTTGTVSFGLNQSSRTFAVPLIGDLLPEGPEAFKLTLSAPAGRATLGAQSTANVRIVDDERGVQLATSTVNVGEGAGTVIVNVSRFGPLTGTLTVNFTTSNGTAVGPGDFAGKSGTLTFGPTIAARGIQVTIKNDLVDEPNETFGLTLSSPTNGALGPRATGTVTIVDND